MSPLPCSDLIVDGLPSPKVVSWICIQTPMLILPLITRKPVSRYDKLIPSFQWQVCCFKICFNGEII